MNIYIALFFEITQSAYAYAKRSLTLCVVLVSFLLPSDAHIPRGKLNTQSKTI